MRDVPNIPAQQLSWIIFCQLFHFSFLQLTFKRLILLRLIHIFGSSFFCLSWSHSVFRFILHCDSSWFTRIFCQFLRFSFLQLTLSRVLLLRIIQLFFQLFLLVLVLYLVQVHLEIGLLVVQLMQSYVGKLFFKTNLSNEGHQGKSITPKQNSCCICKLVFGVYMKNKLHNGKDQITLT